MENGGGQITTKFKPHDNISIVDGNWHHIRAIKNKNVAMISVDGHFTQPGIGVLGITSTDTNHGLFIGGHEKPERLIKSQIHGIGFFGCLRNIFIDRKEYQNEKLVVRGNTTSNNCPLQ